MASEYSRSRSRKPFLSWPPTRNAGKPSASAPTVRFSVGSMILVITKIIDPTENRTVGALALGFPALRVGGQLKNGFLLRDRLYSEAIPETSAPAVAQRLAYEIKGSRQP